MATERYTASVFHLMRIMEFGVQQLGKRLNVPLTEEKVWRAILDQVNKAIKNLDPKLASTVEFSAAAAHLYNVKLAWRNEVMHPKATYTEEECVVIFSHVKAFIQHLADLVSV